MDFSALSYRDIQKIAKEHKVPANKKREQLIKMILAAQAEAAVAPAVEEVAPAVEEVAPVVAPVVEEAAPVVEEDKDFDINNLHAILNSFSDDEDKEEEIAPMVTFTKERTYKDVLSTPQKEVNMVLKRSKDAANRENSENFFSPPSKTSKNLLTTPLSTYKMLNTIEKSAQKGEKNTAIMNFWLTKGNTPVKKNFDENFEPRVQKQDNVQKKLNFNCFSPFNKTRNPSQNNKLKL